jgi:CRP/FNR family cyclic AMP-dependent transcriptional regulator
MPISQRYGTEIDRFGAFVPAFSKQLRKSGRAYVAQTGDGPLKMQRDRKTGELRVVDTEFPDGRFKDTRDAAREIRQRLGKLDVGTDVCPAASRIVRPPPTRLGADRRPPAGGVSVQTLVRKERVSVPKGPVVSDPASYALWVEWRLLEGVPAEQVRELLQVARRRRFARNEVVFHRDDPGDSLHLIAKGRFAVRVMTPLGDVATVAVRGPAESFGEMALVADGSRRSATVAALEEAETYAVFRNEFDGLRARFPQVDRLLFRFLTNEVRMLNERLLEALYLPVETRVVRRLVELASLYAGGDDGRQVVIALPQEIVAELAGATRSTVNQVLRGLQERGIVSLGRGRIEINALDALRARAR